MPHTSKIVEPLPDEFASAEEAGAFWDVHSLADYTELLEPVPLDAPFERRAGKPTPEQ